MGKFPLLKFLLGAIFLGPIKFAASGKVEPSVFMHLVNNNGQWSVEDKLYSNYSSPNKVLLKTALTFPNSSNCSFYDWAKQLERFMSIFDFIKPFNDDLRDLVSIQERIFSQVNSEPPCTTPLSYSMILFSTLKDSSNPTLLYCVGGENTEVSVNGTSKLNGTYYGMRCFKHFLDPLETRVIVEASTRGDITSRNTTLKTIGWRNDSLQMKETNTTQKKKFNFILHIWVNADDSDSPYLLSSRMSNEVFIKSPGQKKFIVDAVRIHNKNGSVTTVQAVAPTRVKARIPKANSTAGIPEPTLNVIIMMIIYTAFII